MANLRQSMQAREITPYVGEILVCADCPGLLQLRKDGNWSQITPSFPVEGDDRNLYCEVCSSNVCQHCDRGRRKLQGTFTPSPISPHHWDEQGWDGVNFID